jgi:hypothetical protein
MASNAIARKNDGARSEVTMLANKDATVEIVVREERGFMLI